ncbi:hypothetical protein [Bradyrhizobium sp.]|uniref:hypothetical protein n=1 Tax=Bradyrhizobium sp. TaxID=376 RepID=UPI001D3BA654|nr:hypothetical protein [Bradyrhizobium sp.]MBV8702058.1 hypothetical protein [Bradyrhizobium sp.]MBV8917279.1 hypothetical protein [Bradyrhizobium sp.]MBV9980528.1 hypothetical protein [Bradyrhizobium sp.]
MIAALEADAIVERCDHEIRVATGPRHLLRTVASAFDACLDMPARTFTSAI